MSIKLSLGQKRCLEIIKKHPQGITPKNLAPLAEVSDKNINSRFIMPLVEKKLVIKQTDQEGRLKIYPTRLGLQLKTDIKPKGRPEGAKTKKPKKPPAPEMEEILHEIVETPAPKPKPKKVQKPKKAPKPLKMEEVPVSQITGDQLLKQLTTYIEALAYGRQSFKKYGFTSTGEMKAEIYSILNILFARLARG